METRTEDQPTHIERIYTLCCWPTGRFGAYFWGALLMLFGGGLLLNKLDLLPSGLLNLFWPLVLIAAGGALVVGGLFRRI